MASKNPKETKRQVNVLLNGQEYLALAQIAVTENLVRPSLVALKFIRDGIARSARNHK